MVKSSILWRGSNYRKLNNFQIFTKHGFWISVSPEEGIQGRGVWKPLHNNLQTNNFFNLLINQFLEKIWYSTGLIPGPDNFCPVLHPCRYSFPELNIFLPNLFVLFFCSLFSTLCFTFNDLVEWESFTEMLIFLKMQLFAVLWQHIEAGKTSLAANHTLEIRVKLQCSGFV